MSVNKVILVGNVGKDPEVRYLDNNVCVANFTLATSERAYTTANGIQIPEKTEWHNVVVWRGLAEIAEKYVRKGTQLYVEGKLRTRTWDDQNGNKRYTTEVFADIVQLLGKKQETTTTAAPFPAVNSPMPSLEVSPKTSEPAPNYNVQNNNESDDLPF